jgi:hypothetical protein
MSSRLPPFISRPRLRLRPSGADSLPSKRGNPEHSLGVLS